MPQNMLFKPDCIAKKYIWRVTAKDLVNILNQDEQQSQSLVEKLSQLEGVSEVDYDGLYSDIGIYYTLDNSVRADLTHKAMGQIIKGHL